jgi:hypothetical protein
MMYVNVGVTQATLKANDGRQHCKWMSEVWKFYISTDTNPNPTKQPSTLDRNKRVYGGKIARKKSKLIKSTKESVPSKLQTFKMPDNIQSSYKMPDMRRNYRLQWNCLIVNNLQEGGCITVKSKHIHAASNRSHN